MCRLQLAPLHVDHAAQCHEATQDLIGIVRIEDSQVPVVGVVLDCFNALNFALHLFVALLEVVVVAVSVRMTVTSHDFNYYRALVI